MTVENKVLETAQRLVALANSNEEEEARTAAVQLARLMREEELVLVPMSEIRRIAKVAGDAKALAKTQEGEAVKKMVMGGVLGVLLAKTMKL